MNVKTLIKKKICGNCGVFNKFKKKLQYFGDETNLHGVGRVLSVNKISWFKRLFWLTVLICTSYGAAGMLTASLNLFNGNAISYTVETTYLEWETPFPAVTLCEQMDTDRIHSYLHKQDKPLSMAPFYKDINFWNSKFCITCTDCKINETCTDDIPQIVKDFRLKCTELLTNCWWKDKWFSCCDRFLPLETEYGICYTFNSKLTANGSHIRHLSRRTGLRNLVFSVVEPVMMRVHSPDETVSVASENLLGKQSQLPLVTDMEVFLKVEETVSTSSVTRLPQKERGCLLWWEKPSFVTSWRAKRYSYTACVLYCRATAQAARCNCTHHFMPQLDGVPMCNIRGLVCLNKNKDLNSVVCDCPMACEETLYKLVHVFSNRYTRSALTTELIERGTRGRVRLVDLPTLRVYRHAIRDRLTLVVDVGGVGGVFFGASLLSIIEIVYLLCIRRSH